MIIITSLDGNYGITRLDATIHSYSVLGTCHVPVDKPSGGPIPPLSTVAVVCGKKLFYSVFGDTNGCDDDDVTGEASYALANVSLIYSSISSTVLLTLRIVVVFPGQEIKRRQWVY